MALLPILGAVSLVGGLLGSLTEKTPRYSMKGMNAVQDLIEKQSRNLEEYYKQSGTALEQQFGTIYSQQMEDATSALASRGIYESPVSERSLGRTRATLADTYASAKSELAGQRLQAESNIDQQRVNYLQNLAQLQYNRQLAKQQKRSSIYGIMGSLGGAALGL